MLMKSVIGLLAVTAISASAATYRVEFLQDGSINGKQLKSGSYKIETTGTSAILKHNKDVTEVPAHLQTSDSKFANTMVRYGQNNEVQEIWVGGTKTKIIFAQPGTTLGGQQ